MAAQVRDRAAKAEKSMDKRRRIKALMISAMAKKSIDQQWQSSELMSHANTTQRISDYENPNP